MISSGSIVPPRARNGVAQARDVAYAEIALAIDEDGRRSVDAIRPSPLYVAFDAIGKAATGQRRAQRDWIHPSLRTPAFEAGEIEVVLMGEQRVVHDPEGVSSRQRVYGFSCFSGALGVRMNLAKGEEAKDRTANSRAQHCDCKSAIRQFDSDRRLWKFLI